jgi:hypothetical protein
MICMKTYAMHVSLQHFRSLRHFERFYKLHSPPHNRTSTCFFITFPWLYIFYITAVFRLNFCKESLAEYYIGRTKSMKKVYNACPNEDQLYLQTLTASKLFYTTNHSLRILDPELVQLWPRIIARQPVLPLQILHKYPNALHNVTGK